MYTLHAITLYVCVCVCVGVRAIEAVRESDVRIRLRFHKFVSGAQEREEKDLRIRPSFLSHVTNSLVSYHRPFLDVTQTNTCSL